jgi:hypothetical protein
MNITQPSHFVGLIELPNTSPSHYEGEALAVHIEKYESVYLSNFLGYELCKTFLENVLVDEPPTSGIWFDLLNGKEYTNASGTLTKWQGFNTIGFNPIANYIYCNVMSIRNTQTTSVGTTNVNVNATERVSPNDSIINAWNEMVGLNSNLFEFLTANKFNYSTFQSINECNKNLFQHKNNFGI